MGNIKEEDKEQKSLINCLIKTLIKGKFFNTLNFLNMCKYPKMLSL
jgi:hypothetical protein